MSSSPRLPRLPPPPKPGKKRSSFPPAEVPTKPRNEKVSDFFQLGQIYEELKPEFQRALKAHAHALLRAQNELEQDPKIEITRR